MVKIGRFQIDLPTFRPGSAKAFLIAAAIVAVATGLGVPATLLVGDRFPFFTFFPAVILATFMCGTAAAIATSGLSIAAAWLFIFIPPWGFMPFYQSVMFVIGSSAIIAVIGTMRYATAHVRHLNESLRLSEEKFRGLLESAPDAMIIVDEERRIALINAQTESLFGYCRGELLGQPIEALIAERCRDDYGARFVTLFREARPGDCAGMVELDGIDKNGRVFPIEISFATLKTETGLLVSNAIRDLTARKKIEAGLAEASKAKSQFLASMSHELRTPLNAIIGFSELIRDAVLGPLSARYREYGGDINESGRHLQNIINDILDISKIEGGRLELREETISLDETLATCQRMVEAMAMKAEVSLEVRSGVALPLLRADEVRFQQVLLNLMSNAVKFTPAGGRVTVFAAPERGGVTIAVEDTGIGMKKEDIAIALEPFRQIDSALSRRFGGTGLGLPLAKALVELHGGQLDIQSVPDHGTTVRIHFPPERLMSAAA